MPVEVKASQRIRRTQVQVAVTKVAELCNYEWIDGRPVGYRERTRSINKYIVALQVTVYWSRTEPRAPWWENKRQTTIYSRSTFVYTPFLCVVVLLIASSSTEAVSERAGYKKRTERKARMDKQRPPSSLGSSLWETFYYDATVKQTRFWICSGENRTHNHWEFFLLIRGRGNRSQ